jgi:hypothetical protein
MFNKKEYMKAYLKNYYEKHKDSHKANMKQHYIDNKEQYLVSLKQLHNSLGSGVYAIYSDNKCLYVGCSNEIYRRFTQHTSIHKKLDSKSNIHLQEFIKINGRNSINCKVIENCTTDKLLEREQYYINLLKPEFNQI